MSFQVGYLIIQCIGRAVTHLTITALELNALAIVVCSLMTSFAWLHKPSDVRTPIILRTDANLSDLPGYREWRPTPLDFVDENGPGWSVNVQPFMRMPEYCVCFATLVFTGIHVAGWNFTFPSRIESILWRIPSLILLSVTAAFWILETMASWKRLGRWTWIYLRLTDRRRLADFEKAKADELSREVPRPLTSLPLPWEFWSIAPVGLLHGVSRLYLLVEAFLELRNLNGTAFLNVDWTYFLPHI
ncbi:hypothetical protein F4680DRAFT_458454 [Xylaria scruposa]|nr:hypothetical protein F4680DRAFT_458454 [Xylaria scruposa]